MAVMRESAQANADSMREWQWKIDFGDYFFKSVPMAHKQILIFGKVLSMAELDIEELETLRSIKAAKNEGRYYVKAHSVIVPDGEYGFTGGSTMYPISEREFEIARENKWKQGNWFPPMLTDILNRVITAEQNGGFVVLPD
jgi:hypothetical protein